jgi:hypothetical protein
MGKLTYLVIHCTASPENMEVSSKLLRQWHTSPPPQGRGWKQVGYSDMIHLNGNVENLVPYNNDNIIEGWEITNGVEEMNGICRHIVYVGGMDTDNKRPKDTRTKEQLTALRNYCIQTIAQHPDILIAGHYQFNSGKACPSFIVPPWLKAIGIPDKNIYQK